MPEVLTRWGAVGWRPVAAGASAACAGRSPRSWRRTCTSATRSRGCRNRCPRRPRPCSCRVTGGEARCRRGRADDSRAARLPKQRVQRLRSRQRRRAGRCPTSLKKGRRCASVAPKTPKQLRSEERVSRPCAQIVLIPHNSKAQVANCDGWAPAFVVSWGTSIEPMTAPETFPRKGTVINEICCSRRPRASPSAQR